MSAGDDLIRRHAHQSLQGLPGGWTSHLRKSDKLRSMHKPRVRKVLHVDQSKCPSKTNIVAKDPEHDGEEQSAVDSISFDVAGEPAAAHVAITIERGTGSGNTSEDEEDNGAEEEQQLHQHIEQLKKPLVESGLRWTFLSGPEAGEVAIFFAKLGAFGLCSFNEKCSWHTTNGSTSAAWKPAIQQSKPLEDHHCQCSCKPTQTGARSHTWTMDNR